MSVQEICRVAENTQLGDGLFLMVLHAPKITELAQCGQFVHIACGEEIGRASCRERVSY